MMPALGGASAQPPHRLDFLIHHPVRAIMMRGGGIPLLVSSSERFAVPKLIVWACRRTDDACPYRMIDLGGSWYTWQGKDMQTDVLNHSVVSDVPALSQASWVSAYGPQVQSPSSTIFAPSAR
ncbi:GSU2403 family nucleotidyltransferase fold protein [Asticcacaulis sp. LKC15W]|uniref:GSU2403 family nucleotidyltransferase fold protein n=1 Tax=Asticcacaulis machinosus TaxID=2984211 RepID=A0ABT5HH72_9CAUL|nr:GSU2403 family nucleotidyltransferase fold protein [Asticcacaulis machinosus]MDC7675601.1 GSU2403 family nucleotidyltransferase fold protein [Asticcacaulis machinosus]